MKIPLFSSRVVLGFAVGVALLIGCQEGPTKPETSSLTVTGAFSTPTAGRPAPDSGVWRTNKSTRSDSGRGKITCTGATCSQSFTLKTALGSDQLVQDVYSLGIHFATFSYTQSGSSSELTSATPVRNPFEDKLLTSFYAAFKAKTPSATPKASDLLAYYADLLLTGDTTYVGKSLPKGLIADSARAALIRLASSKGMTAKALVEKSLLNLTADIVRTLSKALKLDTTVLYPAAPVRLTDSVKVLGDLVQGDKEVAVSGAFTWDATKWIPRTPKVLFKTASGTLDDKISYSGLKFDASSGSLVLSSNLTIKASMAAQVGTDTLIVMLAGESDTVYGRATFKVLRGDTIPPRFDIVEPSKDLTVPNTTKSINLRATASDNKGLSSVVLAGQTFVAGLYEYEADLALGRNILYGCAVDLAGNSFCDTVIVTREKSTTSTDATPPVVTLKTPATDTSSVVAGLPSIELSWTATDEVALRKVTLNGAEVAGEAGLYKKMVALHDGANVFEIKAFDTTGNVATKTVTVMRPADLSKPGIVPPTDKTVESSQATIKLTWTITNIQKVAKITLNGKEVAVAAEISGEYDLKPGPNSFTLVVTDKSGADYTEATVITRASEVVVVHPSITALPDRSVGTDKETDTLVWTVTNSNQVVAATVNDDPVTAGATIQKVVTLNPGPNKFTLSLKDSSGTVVTSSTTINRAIDTALLAVSHPADRTVSPETDSDTLTWKVFNVAKAVSGTLNGKPVTVGSTIVSPVSLVAGNNAFILVLKTAKGDSVVDTVIVARAADATGPSIVWVAPTTKTHAVDASATSFTVQVKVTDPSGVESVTLNGVPTAKEAGDLYSLTLPLPKPDGNPIPVTVVAKDAKGNTSKDSVTVARKVPDGTNKPIIKLVKPTTATGNTLKYEETTLHVEADITDALVAIDPKSVLIGGVLATAPSTGSVYAADVPVPATGKATTITIKAANANGIASTLDVEVTRAADAVKPVITPDASTKTQSVDYGTTSIDLSWTVSDNHKVVTILYNGLSIPVVSMVKQTLALKIGENPVTLVAIDSMGNKDSVGIAITRKQDTVATPVFTPKPGIYTSMQSVSITCATTGAKVSYSIDGGDAKSYTGPFDVGASHTIVATASLAGWIDSKATAVYTIDYPDAVAPTFSPGASTTFDVAQSVKITSPTTADGALIYYTIDGSAPTDKSTKYTGPVSITKNTTLKAIVAAPGFVASPITSADYKIRTTAPTFSPASGANFAPGTKVTLTAASGATIRYTVDGTTPTATSTPYSSGITVSADQTITAIAILSGYENSVASSAKYTVYKPAAKPTFTVTGATSKTVKITSTTGSTIYYTTDNTTPTTATPTKLISGGSFTLTTPGSVTVKAIAVLTGYTNSEIGTQLVTVTEPDVNLASITVGGVPKALSAASATTIAWELEAATSSIVVSAEANDKSASVLVGSSANQATIKFRAGVMSANVTIKVTNGTGNVKTYTLALTVPEEGYFTDPRDKQKYTAVLVDYNWVMSSDLKYGGKTLYNWEEAMNMGDGKSMPEQGICPDGWYIPDELFWPNVLSGASSGKLNLPGLSGDGSNTYWLPYTDSYGGKYANIFIGSMRWMTGGGTSDQKANLRCYKPY